jgi:hypothetical protein
MKPRFLVQFFNSVGLKGKSATATDSAGGVQDHGREKHANKVSTASPLLYFFYAFDLAFNYAIDRTRPKVLP